MKSPVTNPKRRGTSSDPEREFTMDVPDQLFFLLFHASRQRDVQYDKTLAPVNLTLARWRSLAIIRRLEPCSMKDLAFFAAVDRTTLTRSVDQLVVEGLVDRVKPAQDRRVVQLLLTDNGEEVYQRAAYLLRDLNRSLLNDINPEEARVTSRVLKTILCNLIPQEEVEALLGFGYDQTGAPRS